MEKTYRLFVINPGSTSTRVAYYENEKEVCGTKLVHPAEEIAKYKTINDQLPMRRQMVMEYMEQAGIRELDAIVSRGGGGRPIHCGGYAITPVSYTHLIVKLWKEYEHDPDIPTTLKDIKAANKETAGKD